MIENIFPAILVLAVFIAASLFVDILLKKAESRYDSSASESFHLISGSQKAILIFIGVCLALSKLGFNITALVASLGLTGFALGFALKDAISNLVAGIMLVLYKPIRMGDTIEVTGSKGKIADINLRYITIKDEGLTHLVPNSLFLSNKVTIVGARKSGEKVSGEANPSGID